MILTSIIPMIPTINLILTSLFRWANPRVINPLLRMRLPLPLHQIDAPETLLKANRLRNSLNRLLNRQIWFLMTITALWELLVSFKMIMIKISWELHLILAYRILKNPMNQQTSYLICYTTRCLIILRCLMMLNVKTRPSWPLTKREINSSACFMIFKMKMKNSFAKCFKMTSNLTESDSSNLRFNMILYQLRLLLRLRLPLLLLLRSRFNV